MTEILHLMRLASPAKGLPALLAAFFAALSGIALIGAAAWIIASAALAPPLSALTQASRAPSSATSTAFSRTVSPSPATKSCSF